MTNPCAQIDKRGVPVSETEVPAYDAGVHTEDENPVVLLEMFCLCGEVRRFVDPVTYVQVQVADFREKHGGDGHGPTTAKKALTEREARRKAGFRMAGRQAEYEPKEHEGEGSGFDWAVVPVTSEETV